MSSDWKLYIGFQLEVARAIMSRTGWLDVLTAKAVRCIPKSGQVRNSPTGVCSMFMRRFRICSTEKSMGTLPLSRMSTHVVIQPVCARSLRKWITNLAFDCRLFSICKWQITWTRLLGKPDVITLRMLLASLYKAFNGKAGSHSSGTTWVKNNISRMRTKIYILTKQCLLGTMVIIEKYTLFRWDGIERACALSERMQVTRFDQIR